jgi:hypothetical protein
MAVGAADATALAVGDGTANAAGDGRAIAVGSGAGLPAFVTVAGCKSTVSIGVLSSMWISEPRM